MDADEMIHMIPLSGISGSDMFLKLTVGVVTNSEMLGIAAFNRLKELK